MKQVNYNQVKKLLEHTGKNFFTLSDLKKFYAGDKESLKVLLSGWKQRDMIYNLGKGYYSVNAAGVDYLQLATVAAAFSYVSFEYALYYYNLIDQVPSVITLASKGRSKKLNMGNQIFEYSHLKEDLFFGYDLINKMYMASPEKALADLIYLIARGKRLAELDSLNISKINKNKLKSILKKFPRYVKTKAEEVVKF